MTREWFPHDIGARNDSKVLALRRKHGARGVGVYFMLLEIAYEHGGSIFARDDEEIETLEFDLREEGLRFMLETLVSIGLLEEAEKGVFSSARIKEELSVRTTKTEARKAAAMQRWGKSDANAMQKHMQSKCNAMPLHNITLHNITNTGQEGGAGGNDAPAIPTPSEPETKPKEKLNPHEGKTKYINSVYLRQGEHEKLVERYAKEKLSREWVDRGIELLDAYYANKSTKRGCTTKRDEYTDDYRVLISWPLQRCVQEAASKVNLSRQRSYANAPPTYKSNSPPHEVSRGVRGGDMRPVGQIIGKLVGSK